MSNQSLSRCGLDCAACGYREKMNCPGCHAAQGKPFHGECPIAMCSIAQETDGCGACAKMPCSKLLGYAYDATHGDNGERIANLQVAIDRGWDSLTPFCGPSCAKCPSFIATQAGDQAALARIAAEWTQSMGRTFTAADVTCDGCRVEGGRLSAYCAGCDISACARAKGVPTCAHCGDYPCQRIVAPPAREALDAIKARLKRE